MIKRFTYCNIILLLFLLTSCGSYKSIPYFQDMDHASESAMPVTNYVPLTIKPADILGLNVSSRSPESSAIFNYNLNRVNGNVYDTSQDNPLTGYLVDDKGQIHLPLVGNMTVSGLTTTQVSEQLSKALLTYYKDPVVNIRIINFKIGIFGDVLRPNIYTIQNERTTITQALTLAGDLNITAMRKNIILIREKDGKRNFIPIDLTSKKIFESPYYYLQNNDEIYVQPDRTKYATVDRGYRTTSLILTGLSIIAIVLYNLYR